ncbi:AUGMIN subunit 3 [Asimina triloba]
MPALQFIKHLVNQLSRHQFLKIACQLERKTMLGGYSLLKVIESELQGYLLATSGRVARCLSLIQAASEIHEQGAVDDRDTFLHDGQGGIATYVSAPGIAQQVSSLHSDLLSLQLALENSIPEDRNRCINELSAAKSPLMKELAEMERFNAQLATAVEEVTREHREKAEIVKHHPHEVGRERQVFFDFFCNPDRLRSKVKELAARVNALQV